jgi:hypothetical protein
MKQSSISALLFAVTVTSFIGCIKDKDRTETSNIAELETTFTLSENQATSEAFQDDANTIFFEAATDKGLMRGNEAAQTTQTLSCATVTVTPLQGFPKTIVIDFGTGGCTSNDGINRKGKINIALSDSVRKTGTTAVMNFDNYYVQNFRVEGTITWTNTSAFPTISWTRQIANGKVTSPNGYYWLHVGTKSVTQTGGATTPFIVLDDVYSITGNHTVTNPSGVSRTATITEALEKKTICANITKGKRKIQGPAHFAILDYGDGSCDRQATISIDGNTPRNILLPY